MDGWMSSANKCCFVICQSTRRDFGRGPNCPSFVPCPRARGVMKKRGGAGGDSVLGLNFQGRIREKSESLPRTYFFSAIAERASSLIEIMTRCEFGNKRTRPPHPHPPPPRPSGPAPTANSANFYDAA